ncbi:MAG TPA: biotin--[acetyl-CoA-carboxylase] ligase [Niabella sp.]|nr:biotin--[acetyl-CoA-carboxylase] ligase [Niabella sp.]
MAQQSTDNCARLPDGQAFPPLVELLSVDSTNNYALSLLKQPELTERQEMAGHGTAVFAHEQYAGKGQRGRTWQSQKGENIHLSVVLDPRKIGLQQQFLLITMVALVVRDFFDRYAQSDICIKWPNDIYFRNRKAGGILIENIISGNEWKWAVAGIGLNINQACFDDSIAKRAVSLKQITGREFNCLLLATELRNDILQGMEQINTSHLMAAYNRFLFKKDEKALFEKDGQEFEAVVKKVLPNGQLAVQTDRELGFDFGEVSWVIE